MINLSEPSRYKQYEKEKELTNWLSHHNPGVASIHKSRAKGKEYERSLISGLKFEKEPKPKIKSLIDFVASRDEDIEIGITSPSPTKNLPSLKERKALRVGHSVEKVLKNKVNKQNYKAGINPVTLLTAHRRKIILQALTNNDENINETREFSIDKLNQYMDKEEANNNDIYGTIDSMAEESSVGDESYKSDGTSITYNHKKQDKYKKTHGLLIHTEAHRMNEKFERARRDSDSDSDTDDTSILKTKLETKTSFSLKSSGYSPYASQSSPIDPGFTPKWKAYDTMRVRWGYIQPQVKQLTDLHTLDAPQSGDLSNLYLKGDGAERIYGNVQDLYHYQHQMQSAPKRQQVISGHTMKKEANMEVKKAVYKPMFT